jgi:hypothetical protein
MNLNSPERAKSLITPHQWNGETLYFRKVSAAEWRALCKRLTDGGTPLDEHNHPVRDADVLTWWGWVLGKHLCDENGVLTHDTAEKQAELQQLTVNEITSLGQQACVWSGVARTPEEAKKN